MAEHTFIIHTETPEQESALKAFVKALKMRFEVAKSEDDKTIEELQSSLNQVRKIRTGKLPKQTAKDFLNEL